MILISCRTSLLFIGLTSTLVSELSVASEVDWSYSSLMLGETSKSNDLFQLVVMIARFLITIP